MAAGASGGAYGQSYGPQPTPPSDNSAAQTAGYDAPVTHDRSAVPPTSGYDTAPAHQTGGDMAKLAPGQQQAERVAPEQGVAGQQPHYETVYEKQYGHSPCYYCCRYGWKGMCFCCWACCHRPEYTVERPVRVEQ